MIFVFFLIGCLVAAIWMKKWLTLNATKIEELLENLKWARYKILSANVFNDPCLETLTYTACVKIHKVYLHYRGITPKMLTHHGHRVLVTLGPAPGVTTRLYPTYGLPPQATPSIFIDFLKRSPVLTLIPWSLEHCERKDSCIRKSSNDPEKVLLKAHLLIKGSVRINYTLNKSWSRILCG